VTGPGAALAALVLLGCALLALAVRALRGRMARARAAAPGGGFAAADFDTRVERIQQVLPQTQCGQCGFGGCRPYAEALARGEVDIDRCPPGGDAGARALARLLGRPAKPVHPDNGVEKPLRLALIREADCIGCTKCIQACPVDAIVGGPKLMHTVLADLCTGCELCIPPCPVDCIDLVAPAALAAPVFAR
jgi:electron transport complex protein RnfB